MWNWWLAMNRTCVHINGFGPSLTRIFIRMPEFISETSSYIVSFRRREKEMNECRINDRKKGGVTSACMYPLAQLKNSIQWFLFTIPILFCIVFRYSLFGRWHHCKKRRLLPNASHENALGIVAIQHSNASRGIPIQHTNTRRMDA